MNKLLLIVSLISFSAFNVNSQTCTPGANFQDSTYGAWPDTIQNFPPASVSDAYSTDLNFKVPGSVTPELDPSGVFVGSTITGFQVTSVDGLPSGFNYGCNVSNCTYVVGSSGINGCANLYGMPTITGLYSLTINITATINYMGFPVTQPTSFDGYKILIGNAGVIEAIINPITIHPNPANDKITIAGLNEQMKISSLKITNMEGKIVKNITVSSSTMDINLNGFESGVYFLVVNHAGGNETLKFIKE